LNTFQHPGLAEARRRAEADELFAEMSYSEWVRGAVRLRDTDPNISPVFESTIAEPTADLMAVVRQAFGGPVTSRYVSVFADGNRFALEALGRRYGLDVKEIVTTTGATTALAIALKALVAPGDEVLVERPGFDVLTRLAREAGAVVRSIERPGPDFRIDLADLSAKLTPRTRAMLITNLHNPTGAFLEPEEIIAVAARLAEVGAVLIVDEVYADFVSEDRRIPSALLAPNVVTVSSLTKVFGLFALKFGWLAANSALLRRIKHATPDGDMGVSKLSHAVAAHVLEAPEPFEAHWRRALADTRPLLVASAVSMARSGLIEGEAPAHGCMFFPKILGVTDTLDLAKRLYVDHGVLVAPGEYFGSPGHLRVGFGSDPATTRVGLQRLEAALKAETSR